MKYIIIAAIVISCSFIAYNAGAAILGVREVDAMPEEAPVLRLPVSADRTLTPKELVVAHIQQAAYAADVDVDAAVRIANCESGLNPLAASKVSSAKGLYQFIDATWARIGAVGSPFDEQESIRQFMRLYPDHPGMWECK